MADIFDTATRSRIMRAIKSTNTKPELAMAVAFRAVGLRFRRQVRIGRCRPDFVVRGRFWRPGGTITKRLVVFVHGCHWHLCPKHYRAPAGEAWRAKMDGNRRRDIRVRRQLRRLGWRTMVVWEHEVPARAARRVWRRLARD